MTLVARYFKPIRRLEDVRGLAVCYLNESAHVVNRFRHERALAALPASVEVVRPGDGRAYYAGQVLRCRKFLRKGRQRLNVNFTVVVAATGDGGLTLRETAGGEWAVSFAEARDHFVYNHAHTGHSLQGMSVADGVVLFDVDYHHVTREWLYTALTRATSLASIFYWDPAVPLEGLATGQRAAVRADDLRADRCVMALLGTGWLASWWAGGGGGAGRQPGTGE